MTKISKDASIYDLITKYPEIKDALFELGFVDIIKPGMLQTVGRIMTLSKGSTMKKIPFDVIIEKMKALGYDLEEAENE